MLENIKADLIRNSYVAYNMPTFINNCRVIFNSMGFHAIVIYRFGKWVQTTFSGKLFIIRYLLLAIYYCLYLLIIKLYGIDISLKADIGKGFYIGHFSGITVRRCQIGEGCSIHQHVKIGVVANQKDTDFPHIGSNVWIGPHSVITGNIVAGDNSTISAGAVVLDNINSHHLVSGKPARVISTCYDNHSLLNQI